MRVVGILALFIVATRPSAMNLADMADLYLPTNFKAT